MRNDDPPVDSLLRPQSLDESRVHRRSRRAFITYGVTALAGYGGWKWLRSRSLADQTPWPFRRALQFNQRVSEALFSDGHHTPQYPAGSAPPKPRLNGDVGLSDHFDPASWRLHVHGAAAGATILRLDDLRSLPMIRATTRLCCIEGWSILVNWGGARFSDFVRKYPPQMTKGTPPNYVGMSTPNDQYYVGLDVASAMHPQTLLCYEIDGKPLTTEHGAPLRLVIPTKYGIKNIKRIGNIHYTDTRPADYWAEQGYDWYAGL